jgi:hypothetical protein
MHVRTQVLVTAFASGVTLLFGGIASAQTSGTYEYVTKVMVKGDDDRVWINVKGQFSSAHACPDSAFGVTAYPLSDDRTKAWLQIALASFLARGKVYVESTGCSTSASDAGHPVITALQIYRED